MVKVLTRKTSVFAKGVLAIPMIIFGLFAVFFYRNDGGTALGGVIGTNTARADYTAASSGGSSGVGCEGGTASSCASCGCDGNDGEG